MAGAGQRPRAQPRTARTSEPSNACSIWPRRTSCSGTQHSARAIYERIAGPYGPLHAESRRKAGPDDPRTIRLGFDLGLTMERLGQLEPARAMYMIVMDSLVRTLGPRNRQVADVLFRLGDVLFKLGDLAEARARYAEALALLRKQPGMEDSEALEILAHDADAIAARGHPVAARNQMRDVAEVLRRTLGPDNALTRRADARVAAMTPARRSR